MADTTVSSELVVQQWDAKFFAEYIRDNRFKRYMGTNENSVIQMREDLTAKSGDRVTIPLITRLTGNGVTGSTPLKGNEERMNNYGWAIPVEPLRNAIVVDEWEKQKTSIDLRNAARMTLKNWAMEQMRGGSGTRGVGVIDALGAIYDGTTYVNYADATETQKDNWLTNNSDRILFGAAKSNTSAGDHSASLLSVDNSADKLTASAVSLMKRMAKTADPHIRPIRTTEDEEWFVMFANSMAFRDLKNDSTMTQANREARERGRDNPLFRDGDLIWDGVIVREVPEIGVISGVGNSSIDVGPVYLCGAQAVGAVWAQRTKSVVDVDDYDFRYGVGISEIRGVRKMFFNNIQHGVVTGYFAGVADS